jgi:hypothetical protein
MRLYSKDLNEDDGVVFDLLGYFDDVARSSPPNKRVQIATTTSFKKVHKSLQGYSRLTCQNLILV